MDYHHIFRVALNYLELVLLLSTRQMIFLFALSLILAWLLQMVNSRLLDLSHRLFGSRAYLRLFGWFSVPVHELGHLIFAVTFGHRITGVCLFDPSAKSGEHGYVNHSWSKTNLYQRAGNFFIGIGPIFLGSLLVWVLARYLVGLPFSSVSGFDIELSLGQQLLAIPEFFINSISNGMLIFSRLLAAPSWRTLLFLYLSFGLGTNINLSSSDRRLIFPSLFLILLIVLVLNLATAWLGDFSLLLLDNLETALSSLYGILIYVLFLNTLFLLPLWLLVKALRK